MPKFKTNNHPGEIKINNLFTGLAIWPLLTKPGRFFTFRNAYRY
jgi:hypothetical protein